MGALILGKGRRQASILLMGCCAGPRCATNTPKASSLQAHIIHSANKSEVWAGLRGGTGLARMPLKDSRPPWLALVAGKLALGVSSPRARVQMAWLLPGVGGASLGCRVSSQHDDRAPGADVPREPGHGRPTMAAPPSSPGCRVGGENTAPSVVAGCWPHRKSVTDGRWWGGC